MTRPDVRTVGELFLSSRPPALLAVEGGAVVSWTSDEWAGRVRAVAWAMHRRGLKPGERVGLRLPNGRPFLLADLALSLLGAVPVPVSPDLPPHLAAMALDKAGAVALVADTLIDGNWRWAMTSGDMRGLEADHSAWRLIEAEADDAAVVLFTSGTTGAPRPVTLTHRQLLANAEATQSVLPFSPGGVVANWLPLSHAYARNSDLLQSLLAGVTLALVESPRTLARDLPRLRPTNMHGVPHFYEKSLAELGEGQLRERFGDRVDWLKAGGAALRPEVALAYARAGLPLLQGYGMTEAAPVIATCTRDLCRPGTVGKPLPGIDWRIDESGELHIRGANTADGWLATGDLVEVEADGCWRIVGRGDDRVTLATGRKFSPEPVEAAILRDPAVLEAVVLGAGRPFPAVLIHPQAGVTLAADAWLARWKPLASDFPPWEWPGRVGVLPEALSPERGERTATGKLRRAEVLSRHAPLIERLYHA